MSITLNWLYTIALLGGIQGLFLAGVLAVRQRNRTANRILAVAMVAFSIYLLAAVYEVTGLEEKFPLFFGVAHPLPLLFGPLIYLYAVTASDRSRRLRWRDALHFVPAALVVLTALPMYLMSPPAKLAFIHAIQGGEVPLTLRVFTPLKLISGIIYCVITLLFLRHHRARIVKNYSTLERVNLRWLQWLTAASCTVWLVAVVVNVTQMLESPASQRGEGLITLGIALLIYGIGYRALRQPEIFRFDTAEYAAVAEPVTPPAAPTATDVPQPVPAAETASTRYEKSGLSDRQALALKDALLATMEKDRPWQNSELTLADLAHRLSTTPHKLSEVLNSALKQTFYDFVNGYRVRYVQHRIGGTDARNLKILSLALDAGFASKSTFNDVFKKHTGQTPSTYRRAARVS